MQLYAKIENNEIVATEYFKRQELAPEGYLPIERITQTIEPYQYFGNEVLAVQADKVVVSYEVLDRDLNILKEEYLKNLADLRWNKSQKFIYEGLVVPADGAMSALTAVVVAFSAGLMPSGYQVTWKLTGGEFRSWGLPQIVQYGVAVQTHVQTCFVVESSYVQQIEAATSAEELFAIDINVGWPATELPVSEPPVIEFSTASQPRPNIDIPRDING